MSYVPMVMFWVTVPSPPKLRGNATLRLCSGLYNEILKSCLLKLFALLRDLLNISLAVAALAAHVPAKDWGDGGIVNWLRDEMNSHPECIPSFLELLRVLPEDPCFYTCFSPIVVTIYVGDGGIIWSLSRHEWSTFDQNKKMTNRGEHKLV
ncbi:hypothetical protein HYC85_005475 [Camellia sinensis]|uniref:Uncharacterized protein n=1 Tax=Camellia sinensis TaxID=4442 RepID=A0A7J7HZL8_CAMSI|nr:hypothetical protein HYC85_005475 [Camellia sinensis]